MASLNMRELLEAGVHFGHQTGRWHPRMRPYIFGARNGIHVIDLSKTVRMFEAAADFIASTTSQGRGVLFVGTKKQAQAVVRTEAARAKQFFVTERWLGGTLTNWRTIKTGIDKLRALSKEAEDGGLEKYAKKEALDRTREREKLESALGGIRDMQGLPGALFVIDPRREEIAIKEATRLKIPVVAICDTNCDPDPIDYPIPGNDDAIRAISLFTAAIADACLEGRRRGGAERSQDEQTSATFDDVRNEVVTSSASDAQVIRRGRAQTDAPQG